MTKSSKLRKRDSSGRFVSSKNDKFYNKLFKKSGAFPTIFTTKGKKSLNGVNVTNFLRKILGNRVLDIYLKYLGVSVLTTSTVIPLGLVLSADYV